MTRDGPAANWVQHQNGITLSATGTNAGAFSDQQIKDALFAGATYLNLHTQSFLSGELRGEEELEEMIGEERLILAGQPLEVDAEGFERSAANGQGVPEDDAEAVVWFRKAAEQGYARAQFNLALGYDLAKGVPEDDAEAVLWYRKAADQGHAPARPTWGRCTPTEPGQRARLRVLR